MDQDLIRDEEMLETLAREYIKRVLQNVIEKLRVHLGQTEVALLLNQPD